MYKWLSGLVAMVLLGATPALAAPCKTQGSADTPIAFPRNDASDVPFARSMVPAILPKVSGALPSALTCTRSTVSTLTGDYVMGGDNEDAFPRMALRVDGRPGTVIYVAASPEAPGIFALVIRTQASVNIVKRFYAGIPTDRLLADDIRAAMANNNSIMAYDEGRKLVAYSFPRTDAIPPPRVAGPGEKAGPQIMITSSGDPTLLDLNADMRHTPSGFACPQTFDGLQVLLMGVDPRTTYLTCDYRAGTELRYKPDDPIRYRITLINKADETPRSVFDELIAGARAGLRIKGDRTPPLATGPAPAPEFVAYWDTEDGGVQGVWVGKAGGWIVFVRAQYPASPANDVEAGKVAEILFTLAGKQVK